MPIIFILESAEIAWAKSTTLNDGIFGTKISPPTIEFKTFMTKSTLSFSVMLNLVILLSVIVISFFLELLKNKGKIEPLLPKTFPYLTTENLFLFFPA